MEEREIKEMLLKENKEFKKAYQLHQRYEKKLEEFKKKEFLSEKEKHEERELKKRKLILKDKMYYMMTEYRKSLS